MKLVAYTHFERPDRLTGKMRKVRYMVPLGELPKGARAVGTPEIRKLPETEEELLAGCTSAFLIPRGGKLWR